MSTIINTNSLSLLTQNNLLKSQSSLTTAIQRLSSGLRINSAKDDAAGQAIANRFTANIKGLTQAQRNANDGISLAQTTEGALNEINNNLQRVRELTVQASNGSNSKSDLDSIQSEIDQRMQEIDRTSRQTDFNGTKVLGATAATLKIQVGAGDGETIDIGLKQINSTTLGVANFNINKTGTANAAATANDLVLNAGYSIGVAGTTGHVTGSVFTAGTADAQGTTKYTQSIATTTGYTAATSANVFGEAKAATTVKIDAGTGINSYTTSLAGTVATFTSNSAANQTNASVQSALVPTSGAQTTAIVKIGTTTQTIKVDSTGKVTAGDDNSALYLDGQGNLSKTSATGAVLAVIGGGTSGDLLKSMNDVMSATGASTPTQGTISVTTAGGSIITYDAAAGASGGDKWKITNALTQTDMQAKSAAAGSTEVKISGASDTSATTYTITASGVKNGTPAPIYFNSAAATGARLGTDASSDATTSLDYYVHSNGAVMDNSGNAVFKESDLTNVKGFTLTARSGTASTANAMTVIDAALATVDALRGSLGAVQNRFDSVISNLGSTITNLSSSRSRIEDADYATEVSNMTRAQILQQAGTSVLAKANQSTQGVMSLLQ